MDQDQRFLTFSTIPSPINPNTTAPGAGTGGGPSPPGGLPPGGFGFSMIVEGGMFPGGPGGSGGPSPKPGGSGLSTTLVVGGSSTKLGGSSTIGGKGESGVGFGPSGGMVVSDWSRGGGKNTGGICSPLPGTAETDLRRPPLLPPPPDAANHVRNEIPPYVSVSGNSRAPS